MFLPRLKNYWDTAHEVSVAVTRRTRDRRV